MHARVAVSPSRDPCPCSMVSHDLCEFRISMLTKANQIYPALSKPEAHREGRSKAANMMPPTSWDEEAVSGPEDCCHACGVREVREAREIGRLDVHFAQVTLSLDADAARLAWIEQRRVARVVQPHVFEADHLSKHICAGHRP
jgi:hypothetical protein